MSSTVPRPRTRTSGVYAVTVDGEPAGSETWTLDRDGVTLRVRSTIVMRLPEPNRQELDLAARADGAFLKLEVILDLGGSERRAVVTRDGDVLQARIFEDNAPSYENAFPTRDAEAVSFGSILASLPLLASGALRPGAPRVVQALLLPLPDLRPVAVRESLEDLGPEPVRAPGGRAVAARRLSLVTELPGAGSLESALWLDAEGIPLRRTLEHGGRVVDVTLLSREERRLPRELPLYGAGPASAARA